MNKILYILVLMTFAFVTSIQAQQKPPPIAQKNSSATDQKVMDQNLKDKIKGTKDDPSVKDTKITADELLNINLIISSDSQSNENTIAIEGDSNNNSSGIGAAIIKPVTDIISDGPLSGINVGSEEEITKGDIQNNGNTEETPIIYNEGGIEQESVIKDIKPITDIIIEPDVGMEQVAIIKDIKPITDIIILFHPNNGEQDDNHQNYLDGDSNEEEDEEDAFRSLKEVQENSDNYTTSQSIQQDEDPESLNTSLNSIGLLSQSSVEINAYPNPTTDFFTLEFSKMANYDIYIFNVLGQMKQSFQTEQTDSYQIDVANWIPGDYLIQIMQENEVITKRIVVTR